MESPESPIGRTCEGKSVRRDWGRGSKILSTTSTRFPRDLSVSSTSLSTEAVAGMGVDESVQRSSTISAVDRWLKTGVFPPQWEEPEANSLSAHALFDGTSSTHAKR